jgi:nucleotidyltransferase substrate binding protein (TIGR01987 family)
MNLEVRWKQRFENYQKAYQQLKLFLSHSKLNELEEQGLVKAFEYTYELSWNVIRDYFISQGNTNINGSRDAFKEALKMNLLEDGELWMKMILDRNKTSHAYSKDVVKEISENIRHSYFFLFEKLLSKFETLS